MGVINWIKGNWKDIALAVTGIVTVASVVVKITPSQEDDKVLAKIVAFLKVLSLNKE